MQRFLRFAALAVWCSPLAFLHTGCSSEDDHDHANGPSAGEIAAWEDAYEQTDLGKADSTGCSGVVVPDKSGFDERVALTFDDGPNPDTTPHVLDVLKNHGIKATFFINGMRVSSDAARSLLGRILAEGHILANHSQRHLNLKTVSQTKLDAEVKGTHDIILSAGGKPEYFRFPFGSSNCNGTALVTGYGYAVTGWHIDSADWCYAAPTGGVGYCAPSTFRYVPDNFRSDMLGYVMSQVTSKNGGILLFHDIHANTANAIDAIITNLKNAGFEFVNVDDESAFPLLNGLTPPPQPFIGDPCASNADCNFAGGSCHLFTPSGGGQAGFCIQSCEGTCPDQSGKAPTFCTSLDSGVSGSCVSKSDTANGACTAIAGTSAQVVDRFVGASGASQATATCCVPN